MSDPHARIRADIAEYGWHCLIVLPRPGEDFEPFAYTIGLTETYSHPEIAIFGLPREPAHGILRECANRIAAGERFPVDEPVGDLLAGGYEVVFRSVGAAHFGRYLGTAVRYYGDIPFEALVLFWPSKEGAYPWELDEQSLQSEGLAITH